MLHLDHVVLAVRDLGIASAYLRERFGLGTVEGGNHPEWGTGNVIVPIGKHFIEVAGITDMETARSSPVGQIFLEKTAHGDKFLAPVLGSTDLPELTERLALRWSSGVRETRQGTLNFRSAGIETSMIEGEGWPYFFDYESQSARLGHGDPKHAFQVLGIKEICVSQQSVKLSRYLGGPVEGLTIQDGRPSVHSVTLNTSQGDLVLPGKLTNSG